MCSRPHPRSSWGSLFFARSPPAFVRKVPLLPSFDKYLTWPSMWRHGLLAEGGGLLGSRALLVPHLSRINIFDALCFSRLYKPQDFDGLRFFGPSISSRWPFCFPCLPILFPRCAGRRFFLWSPSFRLEGDFYTWFAPRLHRLLPSLLNTVAAHQRQINSL